MGKLSKLTVPMFSLACICFSVGCDSREKEDSITVPSETKPSDSPVAVRIDGRDVTRKDIIRHGRVMLTLNMNKRRTTKVGRGEQKYLNSYCRRAVPLEIGRAAVAAFLRDRGIQVSSNDLLRVGKTFARRYGARSKKLKRWHTIDDLRYMLGRNSGILDQEIVDCAKYDLATNAIIRSSKILITDQMAADRIKGIDDYNHRISATNALIFAKATNVWRQVTAKTLTFEDAAQKYSEDAYLSDGIDWGSFSRDQLADEPAILALLPTLKVGDITPPVESDGGLTILRRDENDNPDIISFSRIFFHLPLFCEAETVEEARVVLRSAKERELVKAELDGYAKRLKVEYPDGTNVMSKVITAKEFKE